jgi:hypothetical protein
MARQTHQFNLLNGPVILAAHIFVKDNNVSVRETQQLRTCNMSVVYGLL